MYFIKGIAQPSFCPIRDIFVHSSEFEGDLPVRMALMMVEFERRVHIATTPAELPAEYLKPKISATSKF